MQRIIILTAVVVMTATTIGCNKSQSSWFGLRGDSRDMCGGTTSGMFGGTSGASCGGATSYYGGDPIILPGTGAPTMSEVLPGPADASGAGQ
jgi:hypothetical protein|tara:strand:- start:1685 stop:1960 length:276 start_codon:yes stop_codon:yes gene_type:complete